MGIDPDLGGGGANIRVQRNFLHLVRLFLALVVLRNVAFLAF